MCELLSAWVNVKTGDLECAGLTSHSETQERLGWSSADVQDWREWEWTENGLAVRVHKDDEHDAAWHKSAIMARFKTRMDALNWAIGRVNSRGHDLDLIGLESAKGLVLPKVVGGGLYLGGLTDAEGLALPKTVGDYLDLGSLTDAKGLTLPKTVGGYLYLGGLADVKGLVLPKSIGGGGLYLGGLRYTTLADARKAVEA